jgi:hypothetical protein
MYRSTLIFIVFISLFVILAGLYIYLIKKSGPKSAKQGKRGFLYWLPRVLGILITLFISLFALDVFAEDYLWWQMIGAFLIHLSPTYLLILILLIAWRWERIGGIIFILIGLGYIPLMGANFEWIALFIVSGPPIMTGGLFLLNYYKNATA